MMKKWLFCLVGVIFSCSVLAQTEEQAQKELKRYQDMKPLAEQMLRESGKTLLRYARSCIAVSAGKY
ncbi:hypothetical protein [Escherichia coli]|uniref:hypothetical protein n=1 Tax=Escherichia coli TaxID=562 RepID=UPI0039A74814